MFIILLRRRFFNDFLIAFPNLRLFARAAGTKRAAEFVGLRAKKWRIASKGGELCRRVTKSVE
jgi:hypothetical protein